MSEIQTKINTCSDCSAQSFLDMADLCHTRFDHPRCRFPTVTVTVTATALSYSGTPRRAHHSASPNSAPPAEVSLSWRHDRVRRKFDFEDVRGFRGKGRRGACATRARPAAGGELLRCGALVSGATARSTRGGSG